MRRLASLVIIGALALSGIGALAQDEAAPTPPGLVNPEIALQVVEDGRGREWTLDPFDVMECFILKRTTSVSQNVESDELDTSLDMQCFIRVGDQMTPIDPFQTDDIGVTVPVGVGKAIVSKPQVAAPGASPNG